MSNNCDETKCSGDCSTCTGDGMTVTLTLDDDSTVECAIVGIFDAAEKEYIALLPLDENGQNEDGEVYLYRYAVGPNGAPQLDNIAVSYTHLEREDNAHKCHRQRNQLF